MKMESAIATLGALAQETRLLIFRALVRAHSPKDGEGGLAAGEISEALNVVAATLSFHLKEMSHAGLVTSRREGRSIIYKANLDAMRELTNFLLEDCCQGACGAVGARRYQKQKECV